jgi:hypothetical protein
MAASEPSAVGPQEHRSRRPSPAAQMPPDTRSFHSAPWLHPPMVYTTSNGDTKSGDIFLTTRHSYENGMMLLDHHARLRWFRPTYYGAVAGDLEVQHYEGQPVLTWAQGQDFMIANEGYQTIATLRPGNGYQTYRHEFQLTPAGTAFIEAWAPVKEDLTSVGGPSDGTVEDSVIQELDVKTGTVLWEWHSLGHIPLTDSYSKPPSSGRYSYFHLNSIQPLPGHRLLISARNTWAVYMIDQQTGDVIWTLGGKQSSFTMGPGTNFEWQHDARLHGDGLLTLFDDGATPTEERQSSAKEIQLDKAAHTAELVRRFTHTPPLLAAAAGSMEMLPNRNVFVGWGNNHEFSEYTPDGTQIFNGQFPLKVYSYRALRFNWSGQPATPPSIAASATGHGATTVYASWNGDTQVEAWRVLAGSRRRALKPCTRKAWTDFETAITLSWRPRYVQVQALNAAGHVLGTSTVRAVHG